MALLLLTTAFVTVLLQSVDLGAAQDSQDPCQTALATFDNKTASSMLLPYSVTTSPNCFKLGGSVQVTVETVASFNPNAVNSFTGLFVQTVSGLTTVSAGAPVGTFSTTLNLLKTLDCAGSAADAVTLLNGVTVSKVMFTWTAPPALFQDVTIKSIVSYNQSTFWRINNIVSYDANCVGEITNENDTNGGDSGTGNMQNGNGGFGTGSGGPGNGGMGTGNTGNGQSGFNGTGGFGTGNNGNGGFGTGNNGNGGFGTGNNGNGGFGTGNNGNGGGGSGTSNTGSGTGNTGFGTGNTGFGTGNTGFGTNNTGNIGGGMFPPNNNNNSNIVTISPTASTSQNQPLSPTSTTPSSLQTNTNSINSALSSTSPSGLLSTPSFGGQPSGSASLSGSNQPLSPMFSNLFPGRQTSPTYMTMSMVGETQTQATGGASRNQYGSSLLFGVVGVPLLALAKKLC